MDGDRYSDDPFEVFDHFEDEVKCKNCSKRWGDHVGYRCPSTAYPFSGALSTFEPADPATKAHVQARPAPSKECPCGIHRVDCTYHR